MNRIYLIISLVILLIPSISFANLNIVASHPDLASVSKEIGGNKVSVDCLSLHTQDPHFVDAKPNLILSLNKADLLLIVGLELEVGWIPVLQTGARNNKIQIGASGYLDCSSFINPLEVPKAGLSRSMGDIHSGGNPHYYYSPIKMYSVAIGIAKRMMKLDPDNSKYYLNNLKVFLKKLKNKIIVWTKKLKKYKSSKIISYHKSFIYLLDWLKLDAISHIEPKPGIAPNASHIAKIISLTKNQKIKLIIQENYYPKNISKLIASKTKAKLIIINGACNFKNGESYINHIDKIINNLAKVLGE